MRTGKHSGLRFAILVTLGLHSFAASALSDTLPDGFKIFRSDLASAGLWANARKSDDSIAKKSLSMVNDAFQSAKNGEIALLVSPHKFLNDTDQKSYCASLSTQFQASPLKFGPKNFESVEDFSDWFSKLAQGKGQEGALLYAKCDKDCSPSYHVYIKKAAGGYSANIKTSCNQPRDKDDNQYTMKSAIK